MALRHQMTMLWEEADESFTLWLKPAGHPSQSGRRERKKEVSSKRGPALSWFLVLPGELGWVRVGRGVGWKTSVWGVVGTVLCRAGSSGRED